MIHRLKLIVGFYKQFAFASLAINLLLLILEVDLFPAVMMKLILMGILLWGIFTTDRKFQLDFYRNLKISPSMLFLGVFCLDLLLFAFTYISVLWFLK